MFGAVTVPRYINLSLDAAEAKIIAAASAFEAGMLLHLR